MPEQIILLVLLRERRIGFCQRFLCFKITAQIYRVFQWIYLEYPSAVFLINLYPYLIKVLLARTARVIWFLCYTTQLFRSVLCVPFNGRNIKAPFGNRNARKYKRAARFKIYRKDHENFFCLHFFFKSNYFRWSLTNVRLLVASRLL